VQEPVAVIARLHDVAVMRQSVEQRGGHFRANLETKRKALEKLAPSSKVMKPPRWRRDASIFAWLDSL